MPTLAPTKKRSREHASRYPYVRKVNGIGCYQARIPIGTATIGSGLLPTKADSINLGIFSFAVWGDDAEWAAGRAAKEFVRAYQPGRDCWDVIKSLQGRGIVPEGVLPRWVYKLPRDLGYAAKVKREGIMLAVGPCKTPEEAYLRIKALVESAPEPATLDYLRSVGGFWGVTVTCHG